MRLLAVISVVAAVVCSAFAGEKAVPEADPSGTERTGVAFIAGDFKGGGYRNGPTSDHRTNNALLNYTEYRGGAGVSYNPVKGISLEFSAGWTLARRIDYFRRAGLLQ
jgi:hypothetical protein